MQTVRVAHQLNADGDHNISLEFSSSKQLDRFKASLTSDSAIAESILSALDAELTQQLSLVL